MRTFKIIFFVYLTPSSRGTFQRTYFHCFPGTSVFLFPCGLIFSHAAGIIRTFRRLSLSLPFLFNHLLVFPGTAPAFSSRTHPALFCLSRLSFSAFRHTVTAVFLFVTEPTILFHPRLFSHPSFFDIATKKHFPRSPRVILLSSSVFFGLSHTSRTLPLSLFRLPFPVPLTTHPPLVPPSSLLLSRTRVFRSFPLASCSVFLPRPSSSAFAFEIAPTSLLVTEQPAPHPSLFSPLSPLPAFFSCILKFWPIIEYGSGVPRSGVPRSGVPRSGVPRRKIYGTCGIHWGGCKRGREVCE